MRGEAGVWAGSEMYGAILLPEGKEGKRKQQQAREYTLRRNVEEPLDHIHRPRDRLRAGHVQAQDRPFQGSAPVGPACPSASCLLGRVRPRPQTQLCESSRKGSSFFWMSEDMGILGPQCAEHKHVLIRGNLISNFHKIVLLL